uniref:Bacitracin resistance protein n=1 Tax=Podoviridae sp. ctLPy3 TaxID=2825244 RepID=A0A8S5UWN5_9CAUD|nr:MAG TPA: bacitracin resistance protein [Podoviridae sp. ctLPy3]
MFIILTCLPISPSGHLKLLNFNSSIKTKIYK